MEQGLPQNTGSFGTGLTGIDALKASFQKRGMDTSVLDTVSGSAAGQQAAPPQVPTTNPDLGVAQQMEQEPKATPRSMEAEIALKALADTAKAENKIAQMASGIPVK